MELLHDSGEPSIILAIVNYEYAQATHLRIGDEVETKPRCPRNAFMHAMGQYK